MRTAPRECWPSSCTSLHGQAAEGCTNLMHTLNRISLEYCALLPIRNGMKDGTPNRTPVMIMVEASWQDQSGTVQKVRARIENKSPGGARVFG